MGDKGTAILAALVILTLAVVWAGVELYRLNRAIQPIANSPIVTGLSRIGA